MFVLLQIMDEEEKEEEAQENPENGEKESLDSN